MELGDIVIAAGQAMAQRDLAGVQLALEPRSKKFIGAHTSAAVLLRNLLTENIELKKRYEAVANPAERSRLKQIWELSTRVLDILNDRQELYQKEADAVVVLTSKLAERLKQLFEAFGNAVLRHTKCLESFCADPSPEFLESQYLELDANRANNSKGFHKSFLSPIRDAHDADDTGEANDNVDSENNTSTMQRMHPMHTMQRIHAMHPVPNVTLFAADCERFVKAMRDDSVVTLNEVFPADNLIDQLKRCAQLYGDEGYIEALSAFQTQFRDALGNVVPQTDDQRICIDRFLAAEIDYRGGHPKILSLLKTQLPLQVWCRSMLAEVNTIEMERLAQEVHYATGVYYQRLFDNAEIRDKRDSDMQLELDKLFEQQDILLGETDVDLSKFDNLLWWTWQALKVDMAKTTLERQTAIADSLRRYILFFCGA